MPTRKEKFNPRHKGLIYYGPHECPAGCGKLVVMTSKAQGAHIFNAQESIIYPNTLWTRHNCDGNTHESPDLSPEMVRLINERGPELLGTFKAVTPEAEWGDSLLSQTEKKR